MLEKQIAEDYKQAMKSRNAVKVSTLSFLRAQLKNVLIDKRAEQLEDADVVGVIKKQIKQRQDSIEQFEKGGRRDLSEKERQELEILKSYLPAEMSEHELKSLIEEAVKESQAAGIKDMGKIMKVLLPKVAGKADNKIVSDLVRGRLAGM